MTINRHTTAPNGLAARKLRSLGLSIDPPDGPATVDDEPIPDPPPVETPTALGVIRHACPSCGDVTARPICEACEEDEPHPLAPRPLPYSAARELAYGLSNILTIPAHVVRVKGGYRVFAEDDVAAGMADRGAIVLTCDCAHVAAL